ncbi:protein-export chaperone SecB [Bosea sp. TWI1241]|jgi:preprotein translocase subunit SecB|uniref:protein-export chaperone SecB n=1 Tax=Bosea sp. TWI1241 TaxID=3148904 RepID=UPI00320B6140
MANENGNGAADANQQGPSLSTLIQYIKDFSFENPNAPRSLGGQQQQGPQIGLQVNVTANALSDSEFEAVLTLEGKATVGESETLFAFELSYAGVFRIVGVPQDQLHAVVMIDCPRLLFPFARQIVADAVRNGGFPPLYIDPIDFATLYRQRVEELQGQDNAPVS